MYDIDDLSFPEQLLLQYVEHKMNDHGCLLIGNDRWFDCIHLGKYLNLTPDEMLGAFKSMIARGFFVGPENGKIPLHKYNVGGSFLTMRLLTHTHEKALISKLGECFSFNDMFVLLFVASYPKELIFDERCIPAISGISDENVEKILFKLRVRGLIMKDDVWYSSNVAIDDDIRDMIVEKLKEVMDDEAIEKIEQKVRLRI